MTEYKIKDWRITIKISQVQNPVATKVDIYHQDHHTPYIDPCYVCNEPIPEEIYYIFIIAYIMRVPHFSLTLKQCFSKHYDDRI